MYWCANRSTTSISHRSQLPRSSAMFNKLKSFSEDVAKSINEIQGGDSLRRNNDILQQLKNGSGLLNSKTPDLADLTQPQDENPGSETANSEPTEKAENETSVSDGPLKDIDLESLPVAVRSKLKKFLKYEEKYPVLLDAYKTEKRKSELVAVFEKVLQENTPVTSIADAKSLLDYLGSLNEKNLLLDSELRKKTSESTELKNSTSDLVKKVSDLEKTLKYAEERLSESAKEKESLANDLRKASEQAESTDSSLETVEKSQYLKLEKDLEDLKKQLAESKDRDHDGFEKQEGVSSTDFEKAKTDLAVANNALEQSRQKETELKTSLDVSRQTELDLKASLEETERKLENFALTESQVKKLQEEIASLKSAEELILNENANQKVMKENAERKALDLAEEVQKLAKEITELKSGNEKSLIDAATIRAEKSELLEQQKKSTKEIGELTKKIEFIKNLEVEAHKDLEAHKSKLKALQGDLEAEKSSHKDSLDCVERLEAEIKALKENLVAQKEVTDLTDSSLADTEIANLKRELAAALSSSKNETNLGNRKGKKKGNSQGNGNQDAVKLRRQISDLETSHQEQIRELNAAGTERDAETKKIQQSYEALLVDHETLRNEHESFKGRHQDIVTKHHEVQKQVGDIEGKFEEAQQKVRNLEGEHGGVLKKYGDIKNTHEELQQEHELLKKKHQTLNRDLQLKTEEVDDLRDQLKDLGNDLVEAKDQLKAQLSTKGPSAELEELKDKVGVLSEESKTLNNAQLALQEKIKGLESENAALEEKAKAAEKDEGIAREEAKLASKAKTQIERSLSEAKTKLAEAEKLLEKKIEEAKNSEQDLIRTQRDAEKLQKDNAEQAAKLRKNVQTLESSLAVKSKELESIISEKQKLSERITELSKFKSTDSSLKLEIASLQLSISHKDELIKDLRHAEESRRKERDELDNTLATLRANNNDLMRANKELVSEKSTLINKQEITFERNSSLSAELSQLQVSKQKVTGELEALQLKFDGLVKQRANSADELQGYKQLHDEIAMKAKEAQGRIENLEDELLETRNLLQERTRESSMIRKLLMEAEEQSDIKSADLKNEIRTLNAERDEAEANLHNALKKRSRELDDVKELLVRKLAKLAELETKCVEFEEKIKTSAPSETNGADNKSQMLANTVTELQESLSALTARVKEYESMNRMLKKLNEELTLKFERLLKNYKHVTQQYRQMQSQALAKPAREPEESAPKKDGPDTNIAYIKNVLLGFLEHKDNREQLLPVVKMLLQLDKSEEKKVMAALR